MEFRNISKQFETVINGAGRCTPRCGYKVKFNELPDIAGQELRGCALYIGGVKINKIETIVKNIYFEKDYEIAKAKYGKTEITMKIMKGCLREVVKEIDERNDSEGFRLFIVFQKISKDKFDYIQDEIYTIKENFKQQIKIFNKEQAIGEIALRSNIIDVGVDPLIFAKNCFSEIFYEEKEVKNDSTTMNVQSTSYKTFGKYNQIERQQKRKGTNADNISPVPHKKELMDNNSSNRRGLTIPDVIEAVELETVRMYLDVPGPEVTRVLSQLKNKYKIFDKLTKTKGK
uniref:Uncharacterized protein n=1 Tax=Strongyloides papillosus TaxID=174720 RepID=A0A0N5CBS5_STREA